MKKHPVFAILLFFALLAIHASMHAQTSFKHMDRSSAMAAVKEVNTEQAAREIGDISTLADGQATLRNLKNIENRGDWPLPAREAAIYRFTRSLTEHPRDAVAPEIMQHLHAYQAQTLVPHEDHGDAFVPLFNIRGAAASVENGWQRREFATEAGVLLNTDPAALVAKYKNATNPNARSGYMDALQQADMEKIHNVQSAALRQLEATPELTPLLGVTAAVSMDIDAIRQLLINGRGPSLSSALRTTGTQLQVSELRTLLVYALERAPTANAALAIAQWWPHLKHDPLIRDLLLAKLAEPGLGASAAMALAQSPDIQTIRDLQTVAGGDSVAAHRAQLALDINRNRLLEEVHP